MPARTLHTASTEEQEPSTAMMKAITIGRYGSPDVLELREIEKPMLTDDGVLVRVRAASINPTDYHGMKGGLVTRLMSRSNRPQQRVPGFDVAGVVEEIGQTVTGLRPGDEVFGTCTGSLAEYALGGKNLIPKPANITFEQAAGIPIAGITALQGLRDKGQLRAGQTVLINGAAGGVGTFAVQIAKILGGEVTGVCSTGNVDLVRSIGADHVVDYTREDFARNGQSYDLVMDLVGNRSLTALRRVLKPAGTLVLTGGGHHRGHGADMIRALLLVGRGLVLSRFVDQQMTFFIAKINPADLLTLKELVGAGKLTPVIDRTYPLSEVPDAMRYLGAGHARGKVVITV